MLLSDLARRRSKRIKGVVPVRFRVAGSKETHLAHTLDLANDGVMLGGFRGDLKVGDRIEIQYRQNRAEFRIAWIKPRHGSPEKLIGARCLESGKQIWGPDVPR